MKPNTKKSAFNNSTYHVSSFLLSQQEKAVTVTENERSLNWEWNWKQWLLHSNKFIVNFWKETMFVSVRNYAWGRQRVLKPIKEHPGLGKIVLLSRPEGPLLWGLYSITARPVCQVIIELLAWMGGWWISALWTLFLMFLSPIYHDIMSKPGQETVKTRGLAWQAGIRHNSGC